MITILRHFVPDIDLTLDGLKAAGQKLGIQGPTSPGLLGAPMRNLPPTLDTPYLRRSESAPNQPEGLSERSQSPQSETEKDEDVHAAESLVNMTDTGTSPPGQSPMTETRMIINCVG
jgi:hypothetical protein